MKKILRILLCVFSVIIALFALIFAVLEGRLLFSLDWIVYDNAGNGFLRYLLRFLLSLFALATAITEIVNAVKQSNRLSKLLYFADIALVTAAIVVCIFATNYVGLVCILLAILLSSVKIPLLYLEMKRTIS